MGGDPVSVNDDYGIDLWSPWFCAVSESLRPASQAPPLVQSLVSLSFIDVGQAQRRLRQFSDASSPAASPAEYSWTARARGRGALSARLVSREHIDA